MVRPTLLISLTLTVPVLMAVPLLIELRDFPRVEAVRRDFRPTYRAVLDTRDMMVDAHQIEAGLRRLDWVKSKDLPQNFREAVEHSDVGIAGHVLDHIRPRSNGSRRLLDLIMLKMSWSRSDVLEAYANLMLYRGELQGLAAASYGLLDKAPRALMRHEAALLAAMTTSPDLPVPSARLRACEILNDMNEPHDCGLLGERALESLERAYEIRPFICMAPFVAKHLSALATEEAASLLRSTLDRSVQWVALHALQHQGREGSVVVLDNASGNVVAFVGEAQAKPVGPVIQPLLFTLAIDQRVVTAASRMRTSAVSGWVVPMRRVLARHLSLPAIDVLDWLGVENFATTLKNLGFTDVVDANAYGPSLALGEVALRPLEVANAFRTLANRGIWTPTRFSPAEITDGRPQRVFSESSSFIIADLMAVENHKVAPSYWTARTRAAGWSVGFSEGYTVSVNVSSGDPAPVWQTVMDYLHRLEASRPPPVPAGLERAASVEEWVLPITVNGDGEIHSRISYPQHRSLIDLDAPTPGEEQKLFIQVVAPREDQNLYLNGRRLGRAQRLLPWNPETGRYTLELRDSQGQVLDKVRFEVRGRRFALAH